MISTFNTTNTTARQHSREVLMLFLFSILFLPSLVTAQETLVTIPQLEASGFNGYINAVYGLFISIAALLAVVKVIVAGVKYMFSDVITQKGEAKKDIQGALLGLVIVLGAVLILTVINPNLTNFSLDGVTTMERPEPTGVRVGGSGPVAGATMNDVLYDLSTYGEETARNNCESVVASNCNINNALDRSYLCTSGTYISDDKRCIVSAEEQAELFENIEINEATIRSNQLITLQTQLIAARGRGNVYTTNDILTEDIENQTAFYTEECNNRGLTTVNKIFVEQAGGRQLTTRIICY